MTSTDIVPFTQQALCRPGRALRVARYDHDIAGSIAISSRHSCGRSAEAIGRAATTGQRKPGARRNADTGADTLAGRGA